MEDNQMPFIPFLQMPREEEEILMLYPRYDKEGKLVNGEQVVGVKEHLSREHRLLFMSGTIGSTPDWANALLALDSVSNKPLKVVIDSIGGDLDTTFLLYDTWKLLKSPVVTFGRYCASAAALLLAAGTKRYLSPHAKVMLHLLRGQIGGDSRDLGIQYREVEKYKEKMVDLFLECGVKRSHDELLVDMDRDFWLEPEEAIEYGLADEIMTPKTMRSWLR